MIDKTSVSEVPLLQRIAGWLVHAFTASGACVGLLALLAIHKNKPVTALWLMGGTILIDAFDGMFARLIHIKRAVPRIDGTLLDNIVDFFTYTIIPGFFLLIVPIVPEKFCLICAMSITLCSAYQFTQIDAKTSDHFFKGFPSYWNIVVFYLFFWQMNPWVNLAIIAILGVLSFVPVKYVYPSRLDYLTHNRFLRRGMLFATLAWGAATAGLLWVYPANHLGLVAVSMGYLILYVVISLYRTWVPLE